MCFSNGEIATAIRCPSTAVIILHQQVCVYASSLLRPTVMRSLSDLSEVLRRHVLLVQSLSSSTDIAADSTRVLNLHKLLRGQVL